MMDWMTRNSLEKRINALEIQVGIGSPSVQAQLSSSKQKTLAKHIGELQLKVDHIYRKTPEINHLPEIIEQYCPLTKTRDIKVTEEVVSEPSSSALLEEMSVGQSVVDVSPADKISSAEKRELILVKYPKIMECYVQLAELSEMDIPAFSNSICEKLSSDSFSEKRETAEQVAQKFHLLVSKNLIVLRKFTEMINEERKFWHNVYGRLRRLHVEMLLLEKKRTMESKY